MNEELESETSRPSERTAATAIRALRLVVLAGGVVLLLVLVSGIADVRIRVYHRGTLVGFAFLILSAAVLVGAFGLLKRTETRWLEFLLYLSMAVLLMSMIYDFESAFSLGPYLMYPPAIAAAVGLCVFFYTTFWRKN